MPLLAIDTQFRRTRLDSFHNGTLDKGTQRLSSLIFLSLYLTYNYLQGII